MDALASVGVAKHRHARLFPIWKWPKFKYSTVTNLILAIPCISKSVFLFSYFLSPSPWNHFVGQNYSPRNKALLRSRYQASLACCNIHTHRRCGAHRALGRLKQYVNICRSVVTPPLVHNLLPISFPAGMKMHHTEYQRLSQNLKRSNWIVHVTFPTAMIVVVNLICWSQVKVDMGLSKLKFLYVFRFYLKAINPHQMLFAVQPH